MKKLPGLFICLFLISLTYAQETFTSPEDYALEFFKHLNQTQTKLTYMNKESAMAKVGTETVQGDISGSLFYNVKIKGLGAEVTLRYTNYCDEEGWTFDGEIITHSSMAQNGRFEGCVRVSGIAPGQIIYDEVKLVKGNPGDGNYIVESAENGKFKVSYEIYLKSKEKN